jgi:hypothetical protein
MQTTGDPTVDAVLTWMSTGYALTSPAFILIVAAVLKFAVIPSLWWLLAKLKLAVSPEGKVRGVCLVAMAVVYLCGLVRRQPLPLQQVLLIGVLAGQAALGIHRTAPMIFKASSIPPPDDDSNQPPPAALIGESVVLA